MFKKTLAAAALATAIVAQPMTAANATSFGFHIDTPHGSFSFGDGYGPGYGPGPVYSGMSCWEARNYLKGHFNKVWKIECHGQIYTFKVKNWGPAKIVKLNRYNGNYWFV
jgi:hypothetical protein